MNKLLPIALFVLIPLAGCSKPVQKDLAKKPPVAQAASVAFTPVAATVGKTFTIGLQSNTSVGWNWSPTFNSSYLTLKNQTCKYAAENPMPGSSCTLTFLFSAKKKGTTTLTMTRTFRGGFDPEHMVKNYRVTIK